MDNLDVGFAVGINESGFCLEAGLGLGSKTTGDGSMLAVASWGTDLRRRISIRRRRGMSPCAPWMASVSSVFTSCAPDSGMSL